MWKYWKSTSNQKIKTQDIEWICVIMYFLSSNIRIFLLLQHSKMVKRTLAFKQKIIQSHWIINSSIQILPRFSNRFWCFQIVAVLIFLEEKNWQFFGRIEPPYLTKAFLFLYQMSRWVSQHFFFCLLVCADLLTKQKPLPKNHLSNLWGKLSYRI